MNLIILVIASLISCHLVMTRSIELENEEIKALDILPPPEYEREDLLAPPDRDYEREDLRMAADNSEKDIDGEEKDAEINKSTSADEEDKTKEETDAVKEENSSEKKKEKKKDKKEWKKKEWKKWKKEHKKSSKDSSEEEDDSSEEKKEDKSVKKIKCNCNNTSSENGTITGECTNCEHKKCNKCSQSLKDSNSTYQHHKHKHDHDHKHHHHHGHNHNHKHNKDKKKWSKTNKNADLSELSDKIINAIKQGVNIQNINGTTNFIIALAANGGSVYIKPEKGSYKSVDGGFVKISQSNQTNTLDINGQKDSVVSNKINTDKNNLDLDAEDAEEDKKATDKDE
jgi:hypothetical protein